ncbi:MAG TPA: energy transducer TonB [Verrucomicrobiae bacterium]|nr:energy transducer TonB [Verrucomicrobiae bacterium]
MSATSIEPGGWTTRRWWTVILMAFGLQILLVFRLEPSSTIVPRRAETAPTFRFANSQMAELMAVQDPTLFALPNRHGFSGKAWLKAPNVPLPTAEWSEPPRLLTADSQNWGAWFKSLSDSNAPGSFPAIVIPKPLVTVPASVSIAPPPIGSRLKIRGELAKRALLEPVPLPSWTNADLLTNSIVQLLVDDQGNPVSAVLLRPGSGRADADQRALELAKSARFEPSRGSPAASKSQPWSAGWCVGAMVFEWQTIPGTNANPPPAVP